MSVMSGEYDPGLIDCHFYFDGSGCVKPSCQYRHCPNAKQSFEVCTDWLAGVCTWYNCPKRHLHRYQNGENGARDRSVLKELIDQGFSEENAEEASLQTSDLNSALIYLQQECGICLATFSHSEMFCLITCEHSMCRGCAVNHFEMQIKSNPITNIVCPYDCVNLETKNDVEIQEYFSLLVSQLKGILKTEVVELLEQKLCDWSLSSNPDFTWCPKCRNGMLIDCSVANYINCMECTTAICTQCKKIWSKRHAGLTCEQYETLLENENVLRDSEEALDKFLASFGVECPSCRTKFVKSSGGCLHFTCSMCKYKFCEGCLQPFYNKGECPQLSCEGLGFHAHHPRNCFFYLRDWEPERLQRLLTLTSVAYDMRALHTGAKCPLVEQKEKEDKTLVDEECGDCVEANFAGLCRKHYTQYLGWLVLKNKVDPILVYTSEELEQILNKARIPLPPNSINYSEILLDLVKGLKQNGGLSNATTIAESYAPMINKEKMAEKIQSPRKDDDFFDAEDAEDDEDDVDIEDEDYEDDENYYKSDDEITVAAKTFHWACRECCYVNQPMVTSCKGCGKTKYTDEEEVEEEEVLGLFGAIALKPKVVNTWICSACTYVNPDASKVCDVCCRTKGIGLEDYEIADDGSECPQCTFINDPNVNTCSVCLFPIQ